MSDLTRAVEEIREHADRYRLAEQYYCGEVGEQFTSNAVRRALKKTATGFNINLASRPVDARLDRIKIAAITVPDQEQATRDLVDRVWDANRMNRGSKQVHKAALVFGDAYLIAWPGDDDQAVELFYNSPITTRVFYSEENPHIKRYAAKVWHIGQSDQQVTRVNLYYPDRIERYATGPGVTGVTDADFLQYVDDDSSEWPISNPYGEVPVFHFRTSDPYGRPEHEAAFGPQNAITKLSATQMATIDFSAFPQRYWLQEGGTDQLVDWDDDELDVLQGDITPSRRRSMLHSEPGSLWQLPGGTVGQFDPASVDVFIQPIGMYTRLMAAATATPLRFFDPQGQIPSGEALRADEAPLAASIEDIEAWFEETWSDALVFAASLAGLSVTSVDVQWQPVQVVDDLTGWQTVSEKVAAGVPTHQALVEAGYQSDLVEEWQDGSDKPNLDSRVDLLVKIGQAMQFLGSAVQLGALSEDTVTQIIEATLGELMPGVAVQAGTVPEPVAPVVVDPQQVAQEQLQQPNGPDQPAPKAA